MTPGQADVCPHCEEPIEVVGQSNLGGDMVRCGCTVPVPGAGGEAGQRRTRWLLARGENGPWVHVADSAADFCRHKGMTVVEVVEAGAPADREALIMARDAIHRLCLERGSTEGYRDTFAALNAALSAPVTGPPDDMANISRGSEADHKLGITPTDLLSEANVEAAGAAIGLYVAGRDAVEKRGSKGCTLCERYRHEDKGAACPCHIDQARAALEAALSAVRDAGEGER